MTEESEPRPDPDRGPYLEMRGGDLDGRWYAKYWNPQMGPLPEHISQALDIGPQAVPKVGRTALRPRHAAQQSCSPGYRRRQIGLRVDRRTVLLAPHE